MPDFKQNTKIFIMPAILEDNIACLEQGIDLLERIPAELYSESSISLKCGSIGEHIRRNIDHFLSLLDGLSNIEVDYDDRKRDPRIPSQRI